MPALITQDARPEIVDTQLTLISKMGHGAFVHIFQSQRRQFIQKEHRRTIVSISRLTLRYLNGTINRTIRNATPEIIPDGSSQTRRNPRVDGYGDGIGPPRSCGLGYWPVLERNRIVVLVQTWTAGGLTGSVANTGHWWGAQCTTRTRMNDDRHAAYDHTANCITLCPDLEHMVDILKIAYGRSWKSRRMSSMRTGEEVGLNISKLVYR